MIKSNFKLRQLIGLCTGILSLVFGSLIQAQNSDFSYQRSIKDVQQNWGKVSIPNEMFQKLNSDFSDIRLYSFGERDTIEVPYFIKIRNEVQSSESVTYKILNQTHDASNYYFTFQIDPKVAINEIELTFDLPNFDWIIQWQGSNDLQQWESILDAYRILSIINDEIEYHHTNLTFPTSQYKYYRLIIPTTDNPHFDKAEIQFKRTKSAHYKTFQVESFQINHLEAKKQTMIDIRLKDWLPVSYVKVYAQNKIAYCRNILIENQSDSIQTQLGWKPHFTYLSGGVLNSNTDNTFEFDSKLLKHIRITIQNKDNQSLQVDSVEVKGFEHEIWARFPELNKDYYLTYGNKNSSLPDYDLLHHPEQIPEMIPWLTIREEISLKSENSESNAGALIENPLVLWSIIVLGIVLIGGFSYVMIKSR